VRSFLRRTRVRLALTVAAVFLGVAALAAIGVWVVFSRLEYNGIDASLSAQAQALVAQLDESNGQVSFQGGSPLPAETPEGIAIDAILLDGSNHVLDRSGTAPRPEVVAPLSSEARSRHSAVSATVSDGAHDVRVLATPVDAGGGAAAVLVVTRPVSELQATLFKLGLLLAAIVTMLTAVVAALAYRLTGRAMRPVKAIAAAARELSEHDLHRRLGLDLPADELGELAATFDGMLARLEAAFATLQQFTADAAHELRAPLALLRAELEVSLSKARTTEEYQASQRVALGEVERLTDIADQLLTLARADAGALVPNLQPVDLSDLVDETVERWQPLAAMHSIRLESKVLDEGVTRADPQLLRRVLDNLLDNAVRHTPAGGTVGVILIRDAAHWTITVWDTGPGVPEAERPSLFERFTRGDPARGRQTGGAGLGLALCRVIVELHGGSITLDDGVSGALFRVRLPALDGDAASDAREGATAGAVISR
jgi:two-component system OmpR family sensor kinase